MTGSKGRVGSHREGVQERLLFAFVLRSDGQRRTSCKGSVFLVEGTASAKAVGSPLMFIFSVFIVAL